MSAAERPTEERSTLDLWPRLAEILDEAFELPARDRAAYVEKAAGDAGVAVQAKALLAAAEAADDFLETPVGELAARLLTDPSIDRALPEGEALGPYRLIRRIGMGGMGEVYEAQDPRLGRRVAVKLLPAGWSRSTAAEERFLREARAAAAVDHPNLCSLHDVGQTGDGRFYLVMAFYEGETLSERLARGPLSTDEALRIAAAVARGLEAAHRAGVVHRDVKPSNIMLAGEEVRLLDFGVARLSDDATLTRTGLVPGTPAYMSPEQLAGREVDERTDIYSLGVVLYEMLVGRRPFAGDGEEEIARAFEETTPETGVSWRQALPADLVPVVARALARNPGERYASVGELRAHLESRPAPATRSSSRRRIWDIGSAAVWVLLGSFALHVYLYSYWVPEPGAETGNVDSVAVLPFESAEPGDEYLGDGLSEDLTFALARLPDLRVAARTSAFRYRGKANDPAQVSHELGVRALLLGRIERRGDELLVSAELIDVEENRQLWGRRYLRTDLLAVQKEMAREVSATLRPHSAASAMARMSLDHPESSEAFDLYLRGRFDFNRRTEEGLHLAVDSFQQAIAADPSYARAYTGLADAYVILTHWGGADPKVAIPVARRAADKALQLDADSSEAHVAMAGVLNAEWDVEGGEAELRKAIELDPGNGFAFHIYSAVLQGLGRHEEAFQMVRRALELDPAAPMFNTMLVRAYISAGQPEKAIEEATRILRLFPEFPPVHFFLGEAYKLEGRYEEAILEYRKVQGSPLGSYNLGAAYAWAGRREEAEAILDEWLERGRDEYVNPAGIALILTALGRKEEALSFLERAYEEKNPYVRWNHFNAGFKALRSDPRYQELLRRNQLGGS